MTKNKRPCRVYTSAAGAAPHTPPHQLSGDTGKQGGLMQEETATRKFDYGNAC